MHLGDTGGFARYHLLVFVFAVIYPHLAYLLATRLEAGRTVEHATLVFDAFVGGSIIHFVDFAMLPSLTLGMIAVLNPVAFAGLWMVPGPRASTDSLGSSRLDRLLARNLNVEIEDLLIPYFAVSTNLSANRLEVHERGPLWRAARASISLPAMLPPVLDGGSLLIDGGVLNNLPADIMRERVGGRVIAVDLSVEQEYRFTQDRLPTGLDFLASRRLPWREPVDAPTLARVITKATTLASRREVELARRSAYLYLHPPVADYDVLDWGKFTEIVQRGYDYACRKLEEHVAAHPDIVHREDAFDVLSGAADPDFLLVRKRDTLL